MLLKVFHVFHQSVDERLILDLATADEVEEFFVHYGVKEARSSKQVIKLNGETVSGGFEQGNVLLEYRMPWYDSTLQARGFNETSCHVHLFQNGSHKLLDYVCIAQFDMRWTHPAIAILPKLANSSLQSNVVYGMPAGVIIDRQKRIHPAAFPKRFNWNFLIDSYNCFFDRHYDPDVLIDQPFTLLSTYLFPQRAFSRLAAWLSTLTHEVYPWANQPLYPTHWGALGGLTERAQALLVAIELAEGFMAFEPLYLNHDDSIGKKLSVPKVH